MNTHLIEMPMHLPKLYEWAAHREIGGRRGFSEGVVLHHLLGETFGPAVAQPFRLMTVPGSRKGTLYAYSSETADVLREKARMFATPTEIETLRIDEMRSLPRSSATWKEGMRIGFDVRFRPVVRLGREIPESRRCGSFHKGAEIDAFLAHVARNDDPDSLSREDVYMNWLTKRLSPATELDRSNSRMAACQRSRIHLKRRELEGPDVVVHGTMTIRDPAAFGKIVAKGIGRHRAYGYGMLLLRPPQRRTMGSKSC